MRTTTAIAVLLAVVGTTLVGVREKSETTRLRYRVFELERRRDALERQVREVRSASEAALAPRGLLEEHDRRRALAAAEGVVADPGSPADAFAPGDGGGLAPEAPAPGDGTTGGAP